jgi:hypothetical protein
MDMKNYGIDFQTLHEPPTAWGAAWNLGLQRNRVNLHRKYDYPDLCEGRMVFVPLATSEECCPVKALQRWLELAGIGIGPLFRPVNRHDQVAKKGALTPQSVALVVKSAMGRAKGADAAMTVAAHSLRAGFVTQAAMVGLQTSAIIGQTGHKSLEMVFRYVRPVHKRQIQSLL